MAINKIRELNDQFRRTFCGGKVLRTVGVASLPTQEQAAILAMVQGFNDFNKSNDPYGEHDFGAFDFDGITYFWKIDYKIFNCLHSNYSCNGGYIINGTMADSILCVIYHGIFTLLYIA